MSATQSIVTQASARETAAPTAVRRKRRLARPLLASAAIVLALGAGAAWWVLGRAPPVHYTTAVVSRGEVARKVTATGTVNPVLTITVGTYVSGVIRELRCDYNTVVHPGQICAKIDPRPFEATFDQYSAQLARDQAVLAKDEMDLARYQGLLAQDSIARQPVEDLAKTVDQDKASVKLDQALVAGAKLNLGYTDIVSPVEGVVVSRNVTQGQTVAASLQTPTLFLIATDLKKMQVDTNVSEGDVGQLRDGEAATFTVDAFPQRVFRGVVTQIRKSPQTVQNVVTYDAVITIDNPDLALMPGMTASTAIVTAARDGVLRVPDQALRYTPPAHGKSGAHHGGGGARVFVLRDGKPARVAVTLGLDDDTNTEVVGGELRAGDAAIVGDDRAGDRAAPQRRALTPRF